MVVVVSVDCVSQMERMEVGELRQDQEKVFL